MYKITLFIIQEIYHYYAAAVETANTLLIAQRTTRNERSRNKHTKYVSKLLSQFFED